MPENRQVLRNADSSDNIEGGADFSGYWFSIVVCHDSWFKWLRSSFNDDGFVLFC